MVTPAVTAFYLSRPLALQVERQEVQTKSNTPLSMRKEPRTRRHFLKTLGIVSSSVTLSNTILASQLGEPERLGEKSAPNYADLRMYTGLLRLFDEFDSSPDKQAPRFRYEFSHPELHRLREAYKLDQIAGTGDEFSKATRLMNWIREHIGYKPDIASALPEVARSLPMNAKGLLEYSFDKGESKGISCYMHAVVMTEACLAIGVKCRIVSLNPLNPFDYDNHLLKIVWSTSRSKWVMVDPSYNAYVSDEKGQLLNPWEIRDLLCRQKNLVCNDELVFYGKKQDSQGYLRYLAKNLVYLHSPTVNSFDSTTTAKQPWLTLTPKHFDPCKRQAYYMKWQSESNKGNWEKGEFEKLMKEQCGLVRTSSIASFFEAPMDANKSR
jgi:hypothetical protein